MAAPVTEANSGSTMESNTIDASLMEQGLVLMACIQPDRLELQVCDCQAALRCCCNCVLLCCLDAVLLVWWRFAALPC